MAENLTIKLRIDGARQTLKAFKDLPKEANDSLRKRSQELAQSLATRVQSAARSDSPQSALIAPTVKARRDRVPVIAAGGNKKVGRNKKPAHKVMFGSEFGSNRLRQFRPHRGSASYWFFKTVEENQTEIADAWRKVADDIEREFSDG